MKMKRQFKRIAALLLAGLMILSLSGFTDGAEAAQNMSELSELAEAGQQEVTVDGIDYELNQTEHTAMVIRGNSKGNVIEIPASISFEEKTYQVTAIADKAYSQYSGATGIVLPEGLLTIGAQAFENAVSVRGEELVIPDSVIEVGEKAFASNSFKKVVIGDGITSIPSKAFYDINDVIGSSEVEIELGIQVEEIAKDAFSDGNAWGEITRLIIRGTTGRLDEVLKSVDGLKNTEIIYDDPDALDADWLQTQINNAPDETETEIVITGNILTGVTITVPEGKMVTLIDDGESHVITSSAGQMFQVNGQLTMDSTSEESRLVYKGGNSPKTGSGNIAAVESGGNLILKDAVLCDGVIEEIYSGAVLVGNGGSLEMSGGVIENFTLNGNMLTGSVCVEKGGNFQMEGGIIRNNKNNGSYYSGGGVLLYTWNKGDKDAVMTMSGDALIQGNKSRNGGGVYLIGNSNFLMKGGKIERNEAFSGYGGGVCAAGSGGSVGQGAPAYESKFTMEGGTICENFASHSGGGIYINSDDVILKGGRIENNTAQSHGGGIYVSEPPQMVKLYNAVVTENTASVMGGGMWFCPTGDATFTVTNGVALYDNRAEGAGDDFASLSGDKGTVTIADRFLGGR